jgi:catechol 2,3-dioxygenase-like lactoylglutathione lyase family enzyme
MQSAPAPTTEPVDDPDIDLPLDGDPEPPPETTDPAARGAMTSGLLAPPVDDTRPSHERPPPNQSTPGEPAPPNESAPPEQATAGAVRYSGAEDSPPPDEPTRPAGTVRYTGPDESTPADLPAPPAEAVPFTDSDKYAPAAPSNEATAAPADQTPAGPIDDAPAAPSNEAGAAPADQTPAGPLNDAPAAPADDHGRALRDNAADPPDDGSEVDPPDRPVISGVDAPPSDSTTTAAAAGAVTGAASATHTANGRAHPGSEEHAGPWADLEGGYQPEERADEVITAYPSARPGPAGAIHGVGITVLVTNLDRSVAFYRDVLGFFEIDRGRGSAVLASGDTRLVLRTVHDLAAETGRLIYLNLEVGDVEAVYQELKAKGVTFVHAPRAVNRGDKLELWSATFTDPDRHNIAISQWRAIR